MKCEYIIAILSATNAMIYIYAEILNFLVNESYIACAWIIYSYDIYTRENVLLLLWLKKVSEISKLMTIFYSRGESTVNSQGYKSSWFC